MTHNETPARLDWVDVAKGICIILVVMMHSTLGVEKAAGQPTALHTFIEWARPFRMPDFFLISGLFLAARIDRPWRAYLDTKVVHFAYFYVLWVNIQFLLKASGMVQEAGLGGAALNYLLAYVQPFGTLWFIYLLALFFVVSKLLQGVPKPLVLLGAALVHLLTPHTGWLVVDEFADRFVFFYTGYAAAPLVFALAGRFAALSVPVVVGGLVYWATVNWIGVDTGVAFVPGVDLLFSYVGVAAVIALSVLLVRADLGTALAYCGRHSIVIYLAFALFMAPTRVVLLKAGVLPLDVVALAVITVSVIGALLLRNLVQGTRADFLFVRPEAFRLQARSASAARHIGMAQPLEGRAGS
jgi:uncharacterized membrane protein YcfT